MAAHCAPTVTRLDEAVSSEHDGEFLGAVRE